MLSEGWSKPNRPIKDRSGHARWAHYFVNGRSLCGRWRWRKGDEPLFKENDLHRFGHCITCRNKLMKRVSKKFVAGWAQPSNEEWYHYFYDGLSLCIRFMQHRDGQAEVEGTRCPHCIPQVKQVGG